MTQKQFKYSVILAWNWCLPQHRALHPLRGFIASNLPWSIKIFTALAGCSPLRRTPFYNLVIGQGARLVYTGNCMLTRMQSQTLSLHLFTLQLYSSVKKMQGWGFMYLPSFVYHHYLVNPRRACALRVTVVVLCVCLSVCLSVCLCVHFLYSAFSHF